MPCQTLDTTAQILLPRSSLRGAKDTPKAPASQALKGCLLACPAPHPLFLQALLIAGSTSSGEAGLAPQATWASA